MFRNTLECYGEDLLAPRQTWRIMRWPVLFPDAKLGRTIILCIWVNVVMLPIPLHTPEFPVILHDFIVCC